jgi:hypothetical protein
MSAPSYQDVEGGIDLLESLAQFYVQYGEAQNALHILEMVKEIRPLSPPAVILLGQCYSQLDQLGQLDQLLHNKERTPADIPLNRLHALAECLRGNFVIATTWFQETLAVSGKR